MKAHARYIFASRGSVQVSDLGPTQAQRLGACDIHFIVKLIRGPGINLEHCGHKLPVSGFGTLDLRGRGRHSDEYMECRESQ